MPVELVDGQHPTQRMAHDEDRLVAADPSRSEGPVDAVAVRRGQARGVGGDRAEVADGIAAVEGVGIVGARGIEDPPSATGGGGEPLHGDRPVRLRRLGAAVDEAEVGDQVGEPSTT